MRNRSSRERKLGDESRSLESSEDLNESSRVRWNQRHARASTSASGRKGEYRTHIEDVGLSRTGRMGEFTNAGVRAAEGYIGVVPEPDRPTEFSGTGPEFGNKID